MHHGAEGWEPDTRVLARPILLVMSPCGSSMCLTSFWGALSPHGPCPVASSNPSPHAGMVDHWASGIEGLQSTRLPQEGCGTRDSAARGQNGVQAPLAQRLA